MYLNTELLIVTVHFLKERNAYIIILLKISAWKYYLFSNGQQVFLYSNFIYKALV